MQMLEQISLPERRVDAECALHSLHAEAMDRNLKLCPKTLD